MTKLSTQIEFTNALPRNLYADQSAARLHLRGIDAAIAYINRPRWYNKAFAWLQEQAQHKEG